MNITTNWDREIFFSNENINNLCMIIFSQQDELELPKILQRINRKDKNICYVCLSKPHSQIKKTFLDKNINCDKLVFVDIFNKEKLDSNNEEKCTYIKNPEDLKKVAESIKEIMITQNCSAVIFDAISTLLIYQQVDSIVKFTFELLSDEEQKSSHKLYLFKKEKDLFQDENKKLINDLYLFADKIVDITN